MHKSAVGDTIAARQLLNAADSVRVRNQTRKETADSIYAHSDSVYTVGDSLFIVHGAYTYGPILKHTTTVSYTTYTDSIRAENRDAYCQGASVIANDDGNGTLKVGKYGSGREEIGVEFPLNVPRGAVIDSCFLIGHHYAINEWTTIDTLKFESYNVDNAAVFVQSTAEYIRAHHALVADSVIWTAYMSPTANTWYTSPNLKNLLQPVISRGGWSANNYVGFAISQQHEREWHEDVWNAYLATGYKFQIRVVYHIP
jgi:hypothetical protein